MKLAYVKVYTADLLAVSAELSSQQIGDAIKGICQLGFANKTAYTPKTESEKVLFDMLLQWKEECAVALHKRKQSGRKNAKIRWQKIAVSDGSNGMYTVNANGMHTETDTETETETDTEIETETETENNIFTVAVQQDTQNDSSCEKISPASGAATSATRASATAASRVASATRASAAGASIAASNTSADKNTSKASNTSADINPPKYTTPSVASTPSANIKTPLQMFAAKVLEHFEPSVKTDAQKQIWFKRNCRCLADIFNFCGQNSDLAVTTVYVCFSRLEKANLQGGYEAVCRNLTHYFAEAQKLLHAPDISAPSAPQNPPPKTLQEPDALRELRAQQETQAKQSAYEALLAHAKAKGLRTLPTPQDIT